MESKQQHSGQLSPDTADSNFWIYNNRTSLLDQLLSELMVIKETVEDVYSKGLLFKIARR